MQQSSLTLTMMAKERLFDLLATRGQTWRVGSTITIFLPDKCTDGNGCEIKNGLSKIGLS